MDHKAYVAACKQAITDIQDRDDYTAAESLIPEHRSDEYELLVKIRDREAVCNHLTVSWQSA